MHLVLNKVKMMKELIHPQDIYDLNKNKTENPFSAPMHKKPNINFDKAQEDQTLAGRKLTHCLSILPTCSAWTDEQNG